MTCVEVPLTLTFVAELDDVHEQEYAKSEKMGMLPPYPHAFAWGQGHIQHGRVVMERFSGNRRADHSHRLGNPFGWD